MTQTSRGTLRKTERQKYGEKMEKKTDRNFTKFQTAEITDI